MRQNKTALIVGGGSGIAAGAARKLAEHGFEIATMSSSGRGEALA
jgi:NAD(P)-dependent dehydrogenase (short-subunit alcohol dehydrogenase family)